MDDPGLKEATRIMDEESARRENLGAEMCLTCDGLGEVDEGDDNPCFSRRDPGIERLVDCDDCGGYGFLEPDDDEGPPDELTRREAEG